MYKSSLYSLCYYDAKHVLVWLAIYGNIRSVMHDLLLLVIVIVDVVIACVSPLRTGFITKRMQSMHCGGTALPIHRNFASMHIP